MGELKKPGAGAQGDKDFGIFRTDRKQGVSWLIPHSLCDTPPHPLGYSGSMEVRNRKEGSVGHPALMQAFPSPTILTSALKKEKAATCAAKPRIHNDWRRLQAQVGPATAGTKHSSFSYHSLHRLPRLNLGKLDLSSNTANHLIHAITPARNTGVLTALRWVKGCDPSQKDIDFIHCLPLPILPPTPPHLLHTYLYFHSCSLNLFLAVLSLFL